MTKRIFQTSLRSQITERWPTATRTFGYHQTLHHVLFPLKFFVMNSILSGLAILCRLEL